MTMLSPFLRKTLLLVLVSVSSALAASKPLLWNVPTQGSSFWGRKAYLTELQQKIAEGPVVVTGLAGVGKSQLTFAYAKQNASKYRVVWVFDASKGMDEQMIDFANKLFAMENKGKFGSFSKKEEASHYVKTLLRTCAFSWLVIFDGAQTFASASSELPETHGDGGKHVLVSASSSQGAPQHVALTPFTDAEALSFLKKDFGSHPEAELTELAKALGNHPMALAQAAAYITLSPGMGPESYVTFFNQNRAAFWNAEHQALQGQELLHTSIKMSLDKLQEEHPNAYLDLCFFAMTNTQHIGQSFVDHFYAQTQGGNTANFGQLVARSFVSASDDTTFTMHGYLRDVVLNDAPLDLKQHAATMGARALQVLFPEKVEDCVAVFEKTPALVNHMKSFMNHMDLISADDAFNLGLRLFYYTDSIMREYFYAMALGEQLNKIIAQAKILDPYNFAVFKSWHGASPTLTSKGLDASISELYKANTYFEQADSEKARFEHVMLLANNLGFFLHWKGDIEAASQCLERAKTLQGSHTETLPMNAIDELDIVLAQDKGEFERSISILDNELKRLEGDPVFKRVEGHFVKSLKACSLLKLAEFKTIDGKNEEAAALRKQAHAISKDAYKHALESAGGQENAEIVGRTLVYLSQSQSALGSYADAEASARKAIKILDDDLLGKPMVIRRQGVAHMALGEALTGQGKLEEAEKEYKAAKDVFEHISSNYAFDDMSELWSKMFDLGLKLSDTPEGKLLMADAMLRHKTHFEMDHPRYVDMVTKYLSLNS